MPPSSPDICLNMPWALEEEKLLTAYHEGGHALLALSVKATDPVHKATIIPRGRALGMVMRLPERDQLSMTRQKLLADMCVAFGGRIAEEKIFGSEKVTTEMAELAAAALQLNLAREGRRLQPKA